LLDSSASFNGYMTDSLVFNHFSVNLDFCDAEGIVAHLYFPKSLSIQTCTAIHGAQFCPYTVVYNNSTWLRTSGGEQRDQRPDVGVGEPRMNNGKASWGSAHIYRAGALKPCCLIQCFLRTPSHQRDICDALNLCIH
jgi:hypothetical protein